MANATKNENTGVWMRRLLATNCPDIFCIQVIKGVESNGLQRPLHVYINEMKEQLPNKKLPNGVRPCLCKILKVREQRRQLAKEIERMNLGQQDSERNRKQIVKKLFRQQYDKIGYRRASGHYGGKHEISITVKSSSCKTGVKTNYHVNGKGVKVWVTRSWSGLNSLHEFTIPMGWYSNVYKRGLSIVENHLVMYAELYSSDQNATVYKAWYVRQAAGFKLQLVEGYIVVAADCGSSYIAPTKAGALRKMSVSKKQS